MTETSPANRGRANRGSVYTSPPKPKQDSAKEIVASFYTMCAMIGIKETADHEYIITRKTGAKTYRAKSNGNTKLFEMLGGRNTALKLLRHVSMVAEQCSQEGNEHLFGTIDGSFSNLVELYPILRGYYEEAKHGASFHTWWSSTV